MSKKPQVLILVGSASDLPVIEKTTAVLKELGVGYSLHISSAHRTPEETKELIGTAESKGYEVIIAGAGMAAHLPGVCAAYTLLPIIGVPLASGPLNGVDALHSVVMMPPGVPVGTMAVGKGGAQNAGIYAVQLLSLKEPELKTALKTYRQKMREKVLAANAQLQDSQ